MDRSPTPEKPKRGPPKRARIATQSTTVKDDAKERKNAEEEEDNVDIGVLLGKLVAVQLRQVSHVNALQRAYPHNHYCPFFLACLRCSQA